MLNYAHYNKVIPMLKMFYEINKTLSISSSYLKDYCYNFDNKGCNK